MDNEIKLFEGSQIRSVWDNEKEKWYFSVVDVVGVLTDSKDPKQYIKKMRSRDQQLNLKWGTICTLVKMTASDGKKEILNLLICKVYSVLKKGYTREWINQRLQAIQVRKELTDTWQDHGVKEGREYAIITNEITKAWPGLPSPNYLNNSNKF